MGICLVIDCQRSVEQCMGVPILSCPCTPISVWNSVYWRNAAAQVTDTSVASHQTVCQSG